MIPKIGWRVMFEGKRYWVVGYSHLRQGWIVIRDKQGVENTVAPDTLS